MIRYIWNLTHGFRGKIILSAAAGIVRVVTGLIFVVLSKRAVDIATGDVAGSLPLCITALVSVLIIELILSAIGNRVTDLSEAAMKDSLQEKLFSRLLTAKWTGQEQFHSGDMLSRLTEDCRVASESLCRTVPTAMTALFQLVGAVVFLWYFSPVLAIILIIILPLFSLAAKAFFRKMKTLTKSIRETESRLQEKMQESLQHRILLLTCRYVGHTMEAINALHQSRFSFLRRRVDIVLYSRTIVVAGFETGYMIAFLWGIKGLFNRTITFGTMTAYLQLAGQIQRPLAELARLLPGLIQSHTSFSRIAEIDRIPTEDIAAESKLSAGGKPIGLSFSNVTFRYPGEERFIFNNFSHIFRPGSTTAVMGETGAGKSTLLRLALALISPQEGRIDVFTQSEGVAESQGAVESENIMESEPVSSGTRNLFLYVPQGNSLMSGTIRQNLMIGKPDATEEEMRSAIHDAAADFVFSLRNGLDTICGERGDGLSEGQAQRIAIARVLLRPDAILLLDEISASLDEETENLLMQRLSERTTAHTILMVTHRKGVLPYCDDILRI